MKKVSFTTKPTARVPASADQWVAGRAPIGSSKRLTVDIPVELHRTMKVQCAMRGERIADVVRDMLASRFASGYQGTGEGAGGPDQSADAPK